MDSQPNSPAYLGRSRVLRRDPRRRDPARRDRILLLSVVLLAALTSVVLALAPPASAGPDSTVQRSDLRPFAGGSGIPNLDLAPNEVAIEVNGVAYPAAIVEGHLAFVRRQAEQSGNARDFYAWGETLHLFDTVTERILAAEAGQRAGFRVTQGDLLAFAEHTLESSPAYLDELYSGDLELYEWDANLQILAKKWMAKVTTGVEAATWAEAGLAMKNDAGEFDRWGEWLAGARTEATIIAYPEHVERGSGPAARTGLALLVLAAGGFIGLLLRGIGRSGQPDLLRRWGWLRWIVRTRLYPEGTRILILAAFAVMMGFLALGSQQAHRNLGSVYLWILWWPLVPFALFFAARSWCAVCPVATIGDAVQRLPGAGTRRPGAWMLVAGIWIIEGTFLAITWLDRAAGLVTSVRLTFTALLLLTGIAVTVALLYERRTFCRHLCFFGALAGNYSMASVVGLRPRREACAGCKHSDCGLRTSDDCPMFEQPRGLRSNRDCNLCLACTRRCDRSPLSLRVRDPLDELANVRRPRLAVAGLAAVLVGVVAVQNLGMLEAAGVFERRVAELTGLGSLGVTSLVYLTALALPLLLLFVSAGGSTQAAAYFGYALIPLDLGAHASHNLLHLLGEGRSIWWVTADFLGLASPLDIPGGHPGGATGAALLDVSTIRVLQIALVLTAAAGSFIVARRMQRRLAPRFPFWGLYGLLIALLVVNLWLFSIPMGLRH